jgi:hypothetical protein
MLNYLQKGKLKMKYTLGVEVGAAIINMDGDSRKETSFKGIDYLRTSPVPDAFDILKILVRHFEGRVFLTSKCESRVRPRINGWLHDRYFYEITGVAPGKLHFYEKDEERIDVCRDLELTHFVHNRIGALATLANLVPNLYLLQPRVAEVARFSSFVPRVTSVRNWQEIGRLLVPQAVKV